MAKRKKIACPEVHKALKDARWVQLVRFPEGDVQELLESFSPVPLWFPIEAIGEDETIEALRHPEAKVVAIDALHTENAKETATLLKKFLLQQKGTKFLAFCDGEIGHVPAIYGKGVAIESKKEVPLRNDSRLLKHAKRIDPRYTMKDLVLGPRTLLRFREAISFIKTKQFCEDQWGFRKKHSRGHGVSVMFHGESGTGKTMAAEVIAGEVNKPLYVVDLSSILSKYIGETEKNLKLIFEEARKTDAILLFDEGDSLFGKRTDVEGSNDRYANLEVNFLLQEIESHDGVVLLSTNHVKNMDSAFLRRWTYSINFGVPSRHLRAKIWNAALPAEMPLSKDIDWNALSQFSLTGGNIRNCVRDAAARAAGNDKKSVGHADFLWAIKRELQKYQREISREMVGEQYWQQVGPEWEGRNVLRGRA